MPETGVETPYADYFPFLYSLDALNGNKAKGVFIS
jgi:hypothetical protein